MVWVPDQNQIPQFAKKTLGKICGFLNQVLQTVGETSIFRSPRKEFRVGERGAYSRDDEFRHR